MAELAKLLTGIVVIMLMTVLVWMFMRQSVKIDAVAIPKGPATLGGQGSSSMVGPVQLRTNAYWIDRFEVSNASYMKYVKIRGRKPPLLWDDPEFNRPSQPVTSVSWNDAQAFCNWAGGRLPSEVEWEKAARGTDGRLYPWGNEFDKTRAKLSGETPADIGSFAGDVSPYGVHDMAGNVSEWVDEFRIAGNICLPNSPVGATRDLQFRAFLRGNNYDGLEHMTKLHHRLWDYPDTSASFFGFRCAYDKQPG